MAILTAHTKSTRVVKRGLLRYKGSCLFSSQLCIVAPKARELFDELKRGLEELILGQQRLRIKNLLLKRRVGREAISRLGTSGRTCMVFLSRQLAETGRDGGKICFPSLMLIGRGSSELDFHRAVNGQMCNMNHLFLEAMSGGLFPEPQSEMPAHTPERSAAHGMALTTINSTRGSTAIASQYLHVTDR